MGDQLHRYKNLLNRQFQADKPNSKWVTDISYIHTGEGILYLSMIRDLYDNSIIAYKTGTEQTVNLVLDYLRKEKRIEKLPLEKNEDKIMEPLNEEVLQIPDDVLMQMVERLPQAKRVVFNLFCVEGYSHKDIAKMLKIKEKTSSSILFKARETLAEEINKYIRSKELL